MPKFLVKEVTQVRTSYLVEANSAPSAIRKIKKNQYNSSEHQSIEQHFAAREMDKNETEDVNNG